MQQLFLLMLIVMCALMAHAEDVSLSAVPAKVRVGNPSLAAARMRIEEAKGRLLGSGRLANPELGVEFLHDRRFQEGNIGLSFDQRFPVTSRLRIEKAISSKLVTAAELEVRDAERKLIAEAQAVAVKLLSLEQQRVLRARQSELAQKLSKFAADKAATGEISALDAVQAQVDSQRLLLEGNKLETERVSLTGKLEPLLGMAAGSPIRVTGEMPALTMPARASWEGRPDYQLAQVSEELARSDMDLAKARKWDDVGVGIFAEGEAHEDGVNGLERKPFFGFKISIPLPLWNRNEGEVVEKNAAALRAALETKALATTISNEASAARAEMEANAKLATETKDRLLPLVLQQTERLEKAYEAGQTDLLTVLRAREQRLQLEAAVLDATRDFHLARIRYESAVAKHAPADPGQKAGASSKQPGSSGPQPSAKAR